MSTVLIAFNIGLGIAFLYILSTLIKLFIIFNLKVFFIQILMGEESTANVYTE